MYGEVNAIVPVNFEVFAKVSVVVSLVEPFPFVNYCEAMFTILDFD